MEVMQFLGVLVAIAIAIFLYLFPAAIAAGRHHRNTAPIFIVNLFLGWTFLFWVICLAWSYSDNVRPEKVRA